MAFSLLIFLLTVLAFQVFPVSLGIHLKDTPSKPITVIFSLIISQAIMFYLGIFVGGRFLHLTEGFDNVVVFLGFFLIGIRISMESFAVRKGERTFKPDNNQSIVLASVAQSINSFLAGLILYYFSINLILVLSILLILAFLFSMAGSIANLNKQSLAFSSLIYLFSGIGLIIISIYLGFFSSL